MSVELLEQLKATEAERDRLREDLRAAQMRPLQPENRAQEEVLRLEGALRDERLTRQGFVEKCVERAKENGALTARVMAAERRLAEHGYELREFQRLHFQWVLATFPGETVRGAFDHLREEVEELGADLAEEKVGEEIADCFLLLLCVASHCGVDLMTAARDKTAENRARTWERTPRGFRHAKTMAVRGPSGEFKGLAVIQ